MRNRAIQFVVISLAVAGVLTVGVGSVAASHGEDVGDREIVEIQTVSEDPERGMVRVELQYHVGSDVAGLQTQVRTADHEVVELNGFRSTATESEYEWDEQTSGPTIEVRVPINETGRDGYDYVDAGEWLITDRPIRSKIRYFTAPELKDEIDLRRLTTAGDEGVAAEGMVYLGAYERYEFSAADEQFALVVSEAADPGWTVAEIRERLIAASDRFDAAGRSDRLTVFVLSDPLRRGGLATSTNAAVWVHEAGLSTPQTTLFHEYIHTRQNYDRTDAVEWTIEGSADYYGKLLALKDGTIEYHRFHHLLERGNEYDDVSLADPTTWERTLADYELGSLVLAAMDERLRAHGGSYADVLRAKNEADERITDSAFESLAAEFDSEMGAFFDRNVRSPPPDLSVPDPTVYDGPNDGATLDLRVPELALDAGESERVTVTLANAGTETSLAPQLSADTSESVTVSLVDSDDSGVTETDEGWVFDHLPAGEAYELTLVVEAEATDGEQIEFSAGDLSDQRDATSVTLDSSEPLDVTLAAPNEETVGETINATAATTPEDATISGYSFRITGPDTDTTADSTRPTATFTPSEAGEYTVSVTVTAADGRTATAERTVDVSAAETDGTETDDDTGDDTDGGDETDDTSEGGTSETTDGESDTDGSDPDDSGDGETESTDDSGSSDGFGDGFGPPVVVAGIVVLALLARAVSE